MITLKIEECWPNKIRIVERNDGIVIREIVMDPEQAKHLFFDGVQLCVELERRERNS